MRKTHTKLKYSIFSNIFKTIPQNKVACVVKTLKTMLRPNLDSRPGHVGRVSRSQRERLNFLFHDQTNHLTVFRSFFLIRVMKLRDKPHSSQYKEFYCYSHIHKLVY